MSRHVGHALLAISTIAHVQPRRATHRRVLVPHVSRRVPGIMTDDAGGVVVRLFFGQGAVACAVKGQAPVPVEGLGGRGLRVPGWVGCVDGRGGDGETAEGGAHGVRVRVFHDHHGVAIKGRFELILRARAWRMLDLRCPGFSVDHGTQACLVEV